MKLVQSLASIFSRFTRAQQWSSEQAKAFILHHHHHISSSYIIIIKWVVKWKRRMPSVCGICPGQMFTCQVQCKWGQGLLVFCISICILYLQLYFCILYQRYPSTLIAIWCNIHLRWVFHVFISWSRQLFPISMKMHRKWWRCLLGC